MFRRGKFGSDPDAKCISFLRFYPLLVFPSPPPAFVYALMAAAPPLSRLDRRHAVHRLSRVPVLPRSFVSYLCRDFPPTSGRNGSDTVRLLKQVL